MWGKNYFSTWKILNVLYLRAPKELEAHIHRFQSTHEYYELTKFQRQTPSQSEDRANFVTFWNPIFENSLAYCERTNFNSPGGVVAVVPWVELGSEFFSTFNFKPKTSKHSVFFVKPKKPSPFKHKKMFFVPELLESWLILMSLEHDIALVQTILIFGAKQYQCLVWVAN